MPQPTNQVENLPPVVRLQVWHLDKQGQRVAANKELSEYLASACLLRDWVATPAPAEFSRDRYVPITVDLAFRDTSHPDQESSAVSLRRLFDDTLIPQILAFFKQQTTEPLQMNVFPVGELLTDETKEAFTHFRLFFSLALKGNISVANAVDVDRNILTETLCVAGSTLESYATLEETVDLKLMSANVLSGQSIGQVWRRIKKQSNTELGRQVAKHYGNGKDSTDNDAKEIKMCWQQTVDSFELFQSLAVQVQLCVAKLTGSPHAAVSKEEVHLSLIQANLATAAFSAYQKHMLTVVEKLQGKYGKDIESSKTLVGLAVAIIFAAGAAAMTGGLVLLPAGVCGVGGMFLGGDQGNKLRKAYQKERAVSQLDDTIGDLADALKDAKLGLASIYCSEVLQMPLQSMGAHERIEVLTNLGIDPKEMGSVYQQELIDLRMGRFNAAYEKFRNEREAVKKDARLKEWIEVK